MNTLGSGGGVPPLGAAILVSGRLSPMETGRALDLISLHNIDDILYITKRRLITA